MEHATRREPMPELLTVKQYASEYQVTERTVYRWVETQAVRVRRHGPRGSIRIVRSDDEPITD